MVCLFGWSCGLCRKQREANYFHSVHGFQWNFLSNCRVMCPWTLSGMDGSGQVYGFKETTYQEVIYSRFREMTYSIFNEITSFRFRRMTYARFKELIYFEFKEMTHSRFKEGTLQIQRNMKFPVGFKRGWFVFHQNEKQI